MPRLEVLIGMIASGKTTYARIRADEGAIVISHDDLTEMLHQRYRYEQGLRDVYRAMETALALNAMAAGLDVIVDRTHLTLESRDRWLSYAQNAPLGIDIETVAVVFDKDPSPALHALRRFKTDPRARTYQEWLKVAEHHNEQAAKEPFSATREGFDDVEYVQWEERPAGPSAEAQSRAMQWAGAAWAYPKTYGKVMDPDLGAAFGDIVLRVSGANPPVVRPGILDPLSALFAGGGPDQGLKRT